MRKILSIIFSILTLSLITSNVIAAGDAENVKRLQPITTSSCRQFAGYNFL